MTKKIDILAGRKIIVGVTGGIAAYKTAMVVSTLVQRGAEVRVVMTEAAARFVTPLTFQTLTRQMVYTDLWQAEEKFQSGHIGLADWGEVCLVAPATANLIGKLAGGLADDLLSTTLLAIDLPVLIAPAMNTRMWTKLVVQNNVALLVDLGYRFVGPETGRLACGAVGEGRLSEPEEIVAAVENLLEDAAAGKCRPAGCAPSGKPNHLSRRGRLA